MSLLRRMWGCWGWWMGCECTFPSTGAVRPIQISQAVVLGLELSLQNGKADFEIYRCEKIKSKEKKLDLIVLSPGYLTFAGRQGLLIFPCPCISYINGHVLILYRNKRRSRRPPLPPLLRPPPLHPTTPPSRPNPHPLNPCSYKRRPPHRRRPLPHQKLRPRKLREP